MTAIQVCELLKKIALRRKTVPITGVLDNARYQRCKVVQELAVSLTIEVLFFPYLLIPQM
jgi:hypothetical protein